MAGLKTIFATEGGSREPQREGHRFLCVGSGPEPCPYPEDLQKAGIVAYGGLQSSLYTGDNSDNGTAYGSAHLEGGPQQVCRPDDGYVPCDAGVAGRAREKHGDGTATQNRSAKAELMKTAAALYANIR